MKGDQSKSIDKEISRNIASFLEYLKGIKVSQTLEEIAIDLKKADLDSKKYRSNESVLSEAIVIYNQDIYNDLPDLNLDLTDL